MKPINLLAVLTVVAGLIAGCSSTGYEKAGGTSTSLQKAAQGIDKGNAQIDVVMAALSDLVNNPGADLKKQFKKFNAALDDLQSLAKDVGGKAGDMQAEGTAYFKQWDKDLAKIQNEDIRNRSSERKSAVSARFERVKANYGQVKTDFAPFMSDLKDIRTALAADLTVGGLGAVKGAASKANQDVLPLRESIGKLSADFKELGVSLSAKTPQPAK